MMTALTTSGALILLLLVAVVAYHRGRRRGRVTLPANLVTELREHKIHCIGEPPQRVALEIGLLCETASVADPTTLRGARDLDHREPQTTRALARQ